MYFQEKRSERLWNLARVVIIHEKKKEKAWIDGWLCSVLFTMHYFIPLHGDVRSIVARLQLWIQRGNAILSGGTDCEWCMRKCVLPVSFALGVKITVGCSSLLTRYE
jgi:hypothetical protein